MKLELLSAGIIAPTNWMIRDRAPGEQEAQIWESRFMSFGPHGREFGNEFGPFEILLSGGDQADSAGLAAVRVEFSSRQVWRWLMDKGSKTLGLGGNLRQLQIRAGPSPFG